MEYTLTVLIDGTPVAVSGLFLNLDEAVDQANDQARHYELDPIYIEKSRLEG
jgi:hypothetical protein